MKKNLALLLVIFHACLCIGCIDASHAAKSSDCKNNMKQISLAIYDHIEVNNDIPRDQSGLFSILPLFCKDKNGSNCLSEKYSKCTLQSKPDA